MSRILSALILCSLILSAGCDHSTTSPNVDWQQSGRHVVAFTLKSCSQCQQDKAQLVQLQEQGVAVVMIDGDERPDLAQQYRVTNYPTYLVIEDGQIKDRSVSLTIIIATLKALNWIAAVLI